MAQKVTSVAGIDLSWEGCRVAVFDAATGRCLREGTAGAPESGDPSSWWDAVAAAIADVGTLSDVTALAATAPGGLVCLDAAGRVIHVDVTADSPLAAATALRERDDAAAAAVEAVLQPNDLLTWWLRGFGADGPNGPRLEELTTDRSAASSAGWWDPVTGRHLHAQVTQALGHAAIKPRVMRPDAWGGEAAKNTALGIRTGRIIGVGADRRAAAVLGVRSRRPDGEPVAVLIDDGTAVLCTSTDVPSAAEGVVCRADATGAFLLQTRLTRDATADQVNAAVAVLHEAGGAAGFGPGALARASGPALVHAAVDGTAVQAAWAATRRRPNWVADPDVAGRA